MDYRTTRARASAAYQPRRGFAELSASFSEFDNRYRAVTYDNPFWLDDVAAVSPANPASDSGVRRGLWEEGRASLEPSNEAWDVVASGGIDLPGRTRITASLAMGERTQDDPFLPITTNTALYDAQVVPLGIDVNGDGVVDARDDPTRLSALVPVLGRSLDATSDVTATTVEITTRPVNRLKLTGRYRAYEYEGTEGIKVVPARTEYVESRLVTDFKLDDILHVPEAFERETVSVEGSYRFSRRLFATVERRSRDYDPYVYDETEVDGAGELIPARDRGTRPCPGPRKTSWASAPLSAPGAGSPGGSSWRPRTASSTGTTGSRSRASWRMSASTTSPTASATRPKRDWTSR